MLPLGVTKTKKTNPCRCFKWCALQNVSSPADYLTTNFRLNWTRLQRACQRHWTSHSDSLVHNFNFLLVLLCIRLTSHQHTAVQLVKLTCHHCNFAHYPLSPLKQPSTVMLQPVNSCFTVLRTRLKYTKLTATAMVCSRIAASKTSPRLWRDRETAISFHSAAPKRKFRGARDASSGEDKSDQAPLQPCSARVGGGRGGEGGWMNSLETSPLLQWSEPRAHCCKCNSVRLSGAVGNAETLWVRR